MDLSPSAEHQQFRREFRAWLKANLPKRDPKDRLSDPGDPTRVRRLKAWQRKLFDAGYLARGWPLARSRARPPEE